ncbi:MAG TPA: 50S ribosomal protein L18 [Vicinamibacterales bacterium]|nr:50S ribosomal protein L18 [Vicinamibacterales bacterium]
MRIKTKEDRRDRIKYRIRRRVRGAVERPRLTVFRSVTHMYVQVVDDATGKTIASASTVESAVKGVLPQKATGGNIEGAKAIGKTIAERLIGQGVKRVVFDRNGFLYHGRVKAVADAAREAGLEF